MGVINGCGSGESTKKINAQITWAKFLRIGRVRKKITKNNASSDLEFFLKLETSLYHDYKQVAIVSVAIARITAAWCTPPGTCYWLSPASTKTGRVHCPGGVGYFRLMYLLYHYVNCPKLALTSLLTAVTMSEERFLGNERTRNVRSEWANNAVNIVSRALSDDYRRDEQRTSALPGRHFTR